MDKTKAIERLNALESEAKELRKIIEAPEPAPSLLTKPVPLSGQDYWSLTLAARNGDISFQTNAREASVVTQHSGGNIFQSDELAKAYADAIDTMLLLRHQPGTAPAAGGTHVIIARHLYSAVALALTTYTWNTDAFMASFISPCFKNRVAAAAAIKTVGEDRILRMFKTLHHVS